MQALACVCVAAWVVVLMGSMLKFLKFRGTLRVARDTELGGVDIVKHGACATRKRRRCVRSTGPQVVSSSHRYAVCCV